MCLSNPAFDPTSPNRVWNAAAHDIGSAMANRCWETRYPPGSIFKILVAATALESETVNRDQRFECNGYFHPIPGAKYAIHDFEWSRKKEWRGHNPQNAGWWTIEDAFIRSCNSTFAQVGVSLGNETLFAMAKEFGFFSPVPIRLGPDRPTLQSKPSSLFHDISDPALLLRDKFTKGSLAQTSIGQYETRATVLQIALVASAVANRGVVMKPTLVKSVMGPNGKVLYSNPPAILSAPISETTAQALKDFMRKAAIFGTGKRAHAECATIAGKTGTAQVPGKKPHAWFVGFAPYDEPEVVIVVLVENSGTGGAVAAPIAGRILNRYFEEESILKEAT